VTGGFVWRRAVLLLLVLLALELLRGTPPASAQQILPALVGGATGFAAGGYVAIGIVTMQARRGRYLYSTEEALGWHAAPVLVGPTVGFLIGLFDQERLRRTVIGGAIGGITATPIGWLVGQAIWLPPEGKWAGAVIGGAAGLLAGSLIGALWPAPAEESAPAAESRALPFRVVIPF
jgi:hypothetical protein